MVNRLIHESGEIDVYVVTGDKTEHPQATILAPPTWHSGLNQYVLASIVVMAAIIISSGLAEFIGYKEITLIMLFVIVLLAEFCGTWADSISCYPQRSINGLSLYSAPRASFTITSFQWPDFRACIPLLPL